MLKAPFVDTLTATLTFGAVVPKDGGNSPGERSTGA